MIAGVRYTGLAIVLVALALVELVADAFYGDLAKPPALPALVSPALGFALARPLGSLLVPASIRTGYARALLHRGDLAAARRVVATLPDGGDAADVRGQLLEADGDPAGALAAYARAGDLERAQRLIDIDVDAGRLDAAALLEGRLAAALTGAGQAAVRARALWRFGQIRQEQAVAQPGGAPALGRASLALYEQALAIAPNEETYLLAAGQQALTLGDRSAASAYYARALEAVPDSADARAGVIRARS